MLRGLHLRNEEGWWSGHSGRSSMLTPPPAPKLLVAPLVALART
jgi:hypothetical protein